VVICTDKNAPSTSSETEQDAVAIVHARTWRREQQDCEQLESGFEVKRRLGDKLVKN
jgi:hypothetical protein